MTRTRCYGCRTVRDVDDVTRTASPAIVRIACGTCGKTTIAQVIPTSPGGTPIDVVEEAKRIFEDVRVDPILVVSEAHEQARAAAAELAPAPKADPLIEDDDRVQAAYRAWLGTPDGREVSVAIRDKALAERKLGKSRGSIQRVAELVRDEATAAGRDADGYRVNNSHLSRLARDLMRKYPELDDFFEIRELRPTTGSCRSCGATVRWVETKAGKKMPVDADGTSHFATCPDSNEWRRSRKPDAEKEVQADA